MKNLKNLKTVFFASIEATKNILFWVIPENTLANQFAGFFTFDLFDLVNLNTGGPLLHCTC